jgi:hypothetical protein
MASTITLSSCSRICTPMPLLSCRSTGTYTRLSRYVVVFARDARSVWPYTRCAYRPSSPC